MHELRSRFDANPSVTPRVAPAIFVAGVFPRRKGASLSMPKQDSLQGSLDLLILKILSRQPGLHGYAIMSSIHNASGEVLRAEEGSLYPALHRMEEEGWLRAKWITKDTGRRARQYELTADGKKQLATEESRWHTVTSAVNRVLKAV
jgi:PadR family transcriptional regulator PadR